MQNATPACILPSLLLAIAASAVVGADTAPSADLATFERKVRPFLAAHCTDCHDASTAKGGVDLTRLQPDLLTGRDGDHWWEVLEQLSQGSMPPAKRQRPPESDLLAVVGWIRAEAVKAARTRAQQDAVVMRRLNRVQYRNTVADLTGLRFDRFSDPTAAFTTDTPTDGFDTVGSGLQVSALHIEQYVAAAEAVLDRAIATQPRPPERMHWRIEPLAEPGRPFASKGPPSPAIRERQLAAGARPAPKGRWDGRTTDRELGPGTGKGWTPAPHIAWDLRSTTPVPCTDPTDILIHGDEGKVGADNTRLIIRGMLHAGGDYRVRIRARAVRPDGWKGPAPRMSIVVCPELTLVQEELLDVEPRTIELGIHRPSAEQMRATSGHRSWGVELHLQIAAGVLRRKGPLQSAVGVIDWVEIEGPLTDAWPPAAHRRLLGEPSNGDETARARAALARFLPQAWRRPVAAAELEPLLALFAAAKRGGASYENAMRAPLTAALTSPHFLFLVEPPGAAGTSSRRLSGHELANRMAYFLWSTMPDAHLRALADAGRLADDATLRTEVARMLDDQRSRTLIEQFVGQWLGLRELEGLTPDEHLFPGFDESLRASMRGEVLAFVEEVLRKDLDARALLDSQFAMLDRRMAEHYGMGAVPATGFHRVDLKPDHRRGGVMTQAGVLAVTADGFRTLPVTRGAFILERLLDEPPPPPPANAGTLEQLGVENPERFPVAKLLDMHRRNAVCAGCHQRIDPFGLALEAYDPIGHLRTHEMRYDQAKRRVHAGPAIETASTLADGKTIADATALKRWLLSRSDRFAVALAGKLATYALGRSLTYRDRPLVERLAQDMAANGYRMRRLIEQIVLSDAFRTR